MFQVLVLSDLPVFLLHLLPSSKGLGIQNSLGAFQSSMLKNNGTALCQARGHSQKLPSLSGTLES